MSLGTEPSKRAVDAIPQGGEPGPRPRASFRIGLIGFGNIGAGLVRHIREYGPLLNERIDGGLQLVSIGVRNPDSPREAEPPEGTHLTANWREIIDDPSIDAVVEVVGVGADGKPTAALEMARAVLASGKHFITANKALIAEHGAELEELADEKGVLLLFEGSVGAGIPIITSLQGGLAANRVLSIHGILNGTCNYILTRMGDDAQLRLADAVKEAQKLGYAEPDPRFDIEGDDAAYKIAILAGLAFGQELHISDVHVEGITCLSRIEFGFARENELAVKLIASAVLHGGELLEVSVRPAFIPARHVLAGVREVNNAMLVKAEPIGETLYYGAGAGPGSTSSGLLADVITAAKHWNPDAGNPHPLRLRKGHKLLFPFDEIRGDHYVRVRHGAAVAADQLAQIQGCTVSQSADYTIFHLVNATEAEVKSFLGNLAGFGIPEGEICHVRYLFSTGA